MRALVIILLSGLFIFAKCDEEESAIIIYEQGDIQIVLLAIEDSRCPKIVECITAGTAKVDMEMTMGESMQKFTLHTNSEFGDTHKEVLGVDVSLVKVDPYPSTPSDLSLPLEDYTVVVDVNI